MRRPETVGLPTCCACLLVVSGASSILICRGMSMMFSSCAYCLSAGDSMSCCASAIKHVHLTAAHVQWWVQLCHQSLFFTAEWRCGVNNQIAGSATNSTAGYMDGAPSPRSSAVDQRPNSPRGTEQCNTKQCDTSDTQQCDTKQCDTEQCDTKQHTSDIQQCDTEQCDTKQHTMATQSSNMEQRGQARSPCLKVHRPGTCLEYADFHALGRRRGVRSSIGNEQREVLVPA
eukprot:1159911-Pelagomonas_calceolata.AAC.20